MRQAPENIAILGSNLREWSIKEVGLTRRVEVIYDSSRIEHVNGFVQTDLKIECLHLHLSL